MLVTTITMYRGRDAESFIYTVCGTLTPEQRDEWRKHHHCDNHYDGDPDDFNNMFFRTVSLGENQSPGDMVNVDGENHPPVDQVRQEAMDKLRHVTVDCIDFDAADSNDGGGTTYYGGTIHIGNNTNIDIEIVCSGNDRGDDLCRWPTMEAVANALGLVSPEYWDDEDLIDEFNRLIHPGAEFQIGLDITDYGRFMVFLPVNGELTTYPIPPQRGKETITGEST